MAKVYSATAARLSRYNQTNPADHSLKIVTTFLAGLICSSALAACAQTAAAPAASAPAMQKTSAAKPIVLKPAAAKPAAEAKPATAKPATPAKAAAPAAPAATAPMNRGILFVDAAHGGVDTGARITDTILEKDVTLSLAFKLRSLLTARGFTVVMTRDSDTSTDPASPITPLSLDDRAGLADHSHPLACLLLHATAAGTGVHLYSSELDPIAAQPIANPWLTAQAAWVEQSQLLQKAIGQAITRSGTALVMSRTSVRPMDSLTCPAIIIELAPGSSDAASVNDADYQQRIASAVAGVMLAWKTQAQPPALSAPSPTLAAPAGVTP